MPVITNNHVREYLDISDVPNSEKDDWNSECSMWIKYKGMYFALSDLGYIPDSKWNASYTISNTGGFVFNCTEDGYIAGVIT